MDRALDDSGFRYFLPEEDGVAGDLPVFRFSAWTDGVLSKLPGPTMAFGLYLPSPEGVTDAGLREVAALKSLRSLELHNTKVTDAGVKELAALKSLRCLDISATQVTDTGLKELAGLKRLQMLFLGSTKVTNAGKKELEKALPDCQISR